MNLKLSQGFELSDEHGGVPMLLKRPGPISASAPRVYYPQDIVWSDGGPGLVARELVVRLVNNMPPSRRDRWSAAEINLVMKFAEELKVLFRLTP